MLVRLTQVQVSPLILQEEQSHERNVVSELLDFDYISQGHLCALRRLELDLMEVVDLSLHVLVDFSLAQVVVLEK